MTPILKLLPIGLVTSLVALRLIDVKAQRTDASPQPAAPGAQAPLHSLLSWADYDGDGYVDATALTSDGRLRLLRNTADGRFQEATLEAGLPELADVGMAIWVDYDGNGTPDLFAAARTGASSLLRNEGGRFADVTAASGLELADGVRDVTWFDENSDGVLDLHVVTTRESLLFRAQRGGAFERSVLSALPSGPGATVAFADPAGDRADEPGDPTHVRHDAAVAGRGPLAPGGSVGAIAGPSTRCLASLEDQGGAGCLMASSTPTYGMLHPLGDDFFIEAGTGHVGIGTTTPFGALHVQGSTFLSGYVTVDGESDGLMALGPWDLSKQGGGLQINETNLGTRMSFTPGGNVGIGTTVPVTPLHVRTGDSGTPPQSGSLLTLESSGANYINILCPPGLEPGLLFGHSGDPAAGGILYDGGSVPDGLQFRTGGNQTRMSVSASGDVGIGTTSPAAKLDVAGEIAVNGSSVIDSSGNWVGPPIAGGGGSIWSLDGTSATYTAGNVGIGTATPASTAQLHVSKGSSGADPVQGTTVVVESAGVNWLHMLAPFGSAQGLLFGYDNTGFKGGLSYGVSPDKMLLYTAGSTRMTIDAVGRIGIGTTSPEARLHVSQGNAPQSANNNAEMVVESSDSTVLQLISPLSSSLLFGTNEATDHGWLSYSSGLGMQFGVAQSARMDIDPQGDVSMGAELDVAGGITVGSTPTSSGISVNVKDGSLWVGGNDVGGLPSGEGAGIRIYNDGVSGKHVIYAYDHATGTGKDLHLGYAGTKTSVSILEIRGGADLVEGFDTVEEQALEPGTVVVIDPRHPGALTTATQAYDSKVAGVVSGAGGVEAGIHLGQDGLLDGETNVAMTGRVYVRCSAENGAILPGDRLTTAALAGHAMKATDASRSDGAVIGKAMSALDEGTGLVLVLVNLQ